MLHKKANRLEIFLDTTYIDDNFTTKYTKSDTPAGQRAWTNYSNTAKHAGIPIIMCDIYNSIPASH